MAKPIRCVGPAGFRSRTLTDYLERRIISGIPNLILRSSRSGILAVFPYAFARMHREKEFVITGGTATGEGGNMSATCGGSDISTSALSSAGPGSRKCINAAPRRPAITATAAVPNHQLRRKSAGF